MDMGIITTDQYGYVDFTQENAKRIAFEITYNHSVMFSVVENDTHYDLVLARAYYPPTTTNKETFQRGIRHGDLFISVIGFGSFGFEIKKADTHLNYYSEKLNTQIGDQLATFLNNIRYELTRD